MKALFYTGTEEMELRDTNGPVAEAGQAVVDVSYCGLCGSDMHAWHGHDARRVPPLVLGHEAVGVVRLGVYAGRRVAINPLMTCGNCQACTRGDVHLCPERALIGLKVPGAFAQAVAIEEGNLSLIPDDLSFENATLAEPLAVCVHAVRVGDERHQGPRGNIVVLGGGAIGLLGAMVYQNRGFERLWIAEPNPLRRKMLEDVLQAEVYDPAAAGPEPGSVDIVFDAVGSGRTRKAACELVRPGGTIVHTGLQDNADGIDTRHITLQEITFLGTYCYTPADFAAALSLLHAGHVTGTGWTEIRPLADGPQSFRDVDQGTAPPKIILAP
jgi:threonine dehydrogenase-like Zn-dependent dehydrogenase